MRPATLLLAATVVAAAGAVVLLTARPPAPRQTIAVATLLQSASPTLDTSAPGTPAPTGPDPVAGTTAAATAPDVLAGPVPDDYLQQLLSETSTPNLDPDTEWQLVSLAGDVLIADLTGVGRGRWPAYFADQPPTTAWSAVSVQAGIARATNDSGRDVEVTLLWRGTTASGEQLERKLATVRLVTIGGHWQPRPPAP